MNLHNIFQCFILFANSKAYLYLQEQMEEKEKFEQQKRQNPSLASRWPNHFLKR